MKMSSSEKAGERVSEDELEMEDEPYLDTSEEDVEDDLEEELLQGRKPEPINQKTEKKLSFSVASLLGQKEEKDSDDSEEKATLRWDFLGEFAILLEIEIEEVFPSHSSPYNVGQRTV